MCVLQIGKSGYAWFRMSRDKHFCGY